LGLIFEKKVEGPSTHAIVIGVGYYNHLPGGAGPICPDNEGLGQLTSPPFSAREFTNWLLTKYHNTETPLSSLNLFISDPKNNNFKDPNTNETKKTEKAKKEPVKLGILDWYSRGNTDKDNLMLFYFCGHGISSGLSTLLLLEDFGEQPLSPFDNSIRFDDGIWLGMDQCAARKQCYFIDACRTGSYKLAELYGYPGDPIIPGKTIIRTRDSPRYYAAHMGSAAYSRPNSPSFFTEALIRALNGAGSTDLYKPWQVTADWLAPGINSIMKTLFKEQKCEAIVTSLVLHEIDQNPIIPTIISCIPKEANGIAQLSYSKINGLKKEILRPKAEDKEWIIDIEVGNYQFKANFNQTTYNSNQKEAEIRPPIQQIKIEVQK
jgi:hypothetical protein